MLKYLVGSTFLAPSVALNPLYGSQNHLFKQVDLGGNAALVSSVEKSAMKVFSPL
jgi:hypothetical protein